jgi:hypothetical protein
METKYMRRSEAAQYLQERVHAYTAATLAKLATVGGGPEFQKLGKFPVYTAEALDQWLASRTGPVVRNTAEAR